MNLAAETVVGLPRTSLVKPNVDLATAHTVPVLLPVPAAAVLPEPREPFRTKADSIDVVVDSVRGDAPPVRGPYASAPSASDLLERAAALGPARVTWESIVLTSDPVLDEKRMPHVAERRERLTRLVKMTLGACVAVCVVALGVSALSGSTSEAKAASAVAVGKAIASKSVVPVEPLDGKKLGKAVRRFTPAAATAAIVHTKRR